MKKNFFKKLAFVMALAMVVSTIVPAAGAFAATSSSLNAKAKVIQLGGEFDFNVLNKQPGYSYTAWASSNTDVATVDKYGVASAEGVGDATLTLSIKKAGKTVKKLYAKVYVRSNISEITDLYLQTPADADLNKLAVGAAYDFGRHFKTVSGATVTSDVTRWEVNATSDKATINESTGEFKALAAGEYTITARAFQSQAKYTAWKADKTLDVVNATQTINVKVVISLTDVKLVAPKKLQLTFDSSVKDVVKAAADVKVDRKLNETYTAMVPVWTFDSISADGKVVTVSTYDALVDKNTYKVTAAGSTFELYAQIGTPVSLTMNDQTIPAGTASSLVYTMLDQYNVDVQSSYGVAVNSSVPLVGGKLTLANDQVAFVELTYTVQNSDGSATVLRTGVKTVKGVAATVGSALEWNVYGSEDFSKTAQFVKMGDYAQNLYGRIKKSDNTYTASSTYKFVSLNESILLIDAADNSLVPISAGTALVKVVDKTNNDALVTYINVEVKAAPATDSIKVSSPVVTLSNGITFNTVSTPESKSVTVTKLDQYATETAANVQESYVINTNRTTDLATISVSGNTITFTAVAGKSGSFNYYVKAADKVTTITVNVAAPGVLSSYVVDLDQTSIDNYVANADTASIVNFKVYGVDANGIKKEKVSQTASGAAVSYEVKNGDGAVVASGAAFDGDESYSVTDLDGVEKVGTYTVNVSIGGIVVSKSFEVVNTRQPLVATVKALSTTAANSATIEAVVANLLGLKVGDDAVAIKAGSVKFQSSNSNLIAANGSAFHASNDGTVTIFITEVATNDKGVDQTVAVNQAFTVTVQ